MENLDFPHWLRQRRKLLDLTQAELAQQVGVSAVTIRKMESGERKPSQELAKLLALALHLPEREHAAFTHFARTDEATEALPLPAWDADQPVWRRSGLPSAGPPALAAATPHLTLLYELFPSRQFSYQAAREGSQLATIEATGSVHGDLEGHIQLHITQLIKGKPAGFDYSLALPMPLGVLFKIQAGEETLEGSYTGTVTPALDAQGNGEAHVKGTGRIFSVTAGFVEFFLDNVLVEDVVKMVEGQGTGGKGRMSLTASS